MKKIAYLRFFLALLTTVDFVLDILYEGKVSRTTLYADGLDGFFTAAFVAYCVLEGIQELDNKELPKTFKILGVFIEVIIFFAGLVILKGTVKGLDTFWSPIVVIVQSVGLMVLIFIDAKKIRIT